MYNKGASYINKMNKKKEGTSFRKFFLNLIKKLLKVKILIPIILGSSVIYGYNQLIKKEPVKLSGSIQYKGDIKVFFEKNQSETISPLCGFLGEQNKENYKGVSLFAKKVELENTILHDSITKRLAGHDSTCVSGYLITCPRAQGNINWRPEVYFRGSLYEVGDKGLEVSAQPIMYRYDFGTEPYFEIITKDKVAIELLDTISIINYIPCASTPVSIHQDFDINTSKISETTISETYPWDIGTIQWEEYKDKVSDTIRYIKNSPYATPDYPTIDLASNRSVFHIAHGMALRTEAATIDLSDKEYYLVVETYFPVRVTVFGITLDDIREVNTFNQKSGYNYPSMGQLLRKKGNLQARITEFVEDSYFEKIIKNYSVKNYLFPEGISIRRRHLDEETMIYYDPQFLRKIGYYKMTVAQRDSISADLIRKKRPNQDTTGQWGLYNSHAKKMVMLLPIEIYNTYHNAISFSTYTVKEIQSNPPILPASNGIGVFGILKSIEFQKAKGDVNSGTTNYPLNVESNFLLSDLKKFDYDNNSISLSNFLMKKNELDFNGIGYASINGNNISLSKFDSIGYKMTFYFSSLLFFLIAGIGLFDIKVPSPIKKRNMRIVKIFLASSIELTNDRRDFEIFIGRQNKHLKNKDIFLELQIWEDFLDVVSKTRLQDEYNKAISESDIFVSLFFTKIGKYTNEEFEHALDSFRNNNKPLILTYFKNEKVEMESIRQSDISTVFSFKNRLTELGHFYTIYDNIDSLKHHFSQQLVKVGVV